MIIIKVCVISEKTFKPLMYGVGYFEDKNEFWNFNTKSKLDDVDAPSDLSWIKNLHDQEKVVNRYLTTQLTDDEIKELLKDKDVREKVKPYLRNETLKDLGL